MKYIITGFMALIIIAVTILAINVPDRFMRWVFIATAVLMAALFYVCIWETML